MRFTTSFFFDEFRLRVFCSRTKPSCATFECHSFVIDFLPGAFFFKTFLFEPDDLSPRNKTHFENALVLKLLHGSRYGR